MMFVWELDVQSIVLMSFLMIKINYMSASKLVMINRYLCSTPTLHIESMCNVRYVMFNRDVTPTHVVSLY